MAPPRRYFDTEDPEQAAARAAGLVPDPAKDALYGGFGLPPPATTPVPAGPPIDPAAQTHGAPPPNPIDRMATLTPVVEPPLVPVDAALPPHGAKAASHEPVSPPVVEAPVGPSKTVVTDTAPQRTYRVESAASRAAATGAREAHGEALSAQEQQANADVKTAEIEAQRLARVDEVARAHAAERAQGEAARQEVIKQKIATEQTRAGELEKAAKITDYWDDMSAPKRVVSAFLSGLSTYAHIRAGGQGEAPGTAAFEKAAANDRAFKEKRFLRTKEMHQLAQTDVAAAEDRLRQFRVDSLAEEQAKIVAVAREFDALAGRLKVPQAQAAAAKERAALKDAYNQREIARAQHYETQVQSGGRTTTTTTDAASGGAGLANVVYGSGGTPLFQVSGRSPDEVKKAQERVDAYRDVMATAGKLQGLFQKGAAVPWSERDNQQTALAETLRQKARKAGEMGALDKGVIESMEKMIPTGAGALGGGTDKLNTWIDAARTSAAVQFDGYGVDGKKTVRILDRESGPAAGAQRALPTTREAAAIAAIANDPSNPKSTQARRALKEMAAARRASQ